MDSPLRSAGVRPILLRRDRRMSERVELTRGFHRQYICETRILLYANHTVFRTVPYEQSGRDGCRLHE